MLIVVDSADETQFFLGGDPGLKFPVRSYQTALQKLKSNQRDSPQHYFFLHLLGCLCTAEYLAAHHWFHLNPSRGPDSKKEEFPVNFMIAMLNQVRKQFPHEKVPTSENVLHQAVNARCRFEEGKLKKSAALTETAVSVAPTEASVSIASTGPFVSVASTGTSVYVGTP